MTEEEWLCDRDSTQMVMHLRERSTTRKKRLMAVAAVHSLQCSSRFPLLVDMIRCIENILDKEKPFDPIREHRRAVGNFSSGLRWWFEDQRSDWLEMAPGVDALSKRDADELLPAVKWLRWAMREDISIRLCQDYPSEAPLDASLLRDIFGNPFRPVAFDPNWRTSTVVSIANGMYESRDFAPMPLLADALQDAGCAEEQILDHCRGPGPHVKGCWVVDLVLGKE